MDQISLSFKSAVQYIKAIQFLEERLGHNASFLMMNAFSISHDSPNERASKICEFLKFSHKPITVFESKNEENFAGRINETPDMVYIEITPSTCQDSNYLSAVLAHEIMHHYLSRNGIQKFLTLDNEVLTDIATIYTGLGKLTLNGVYTESISYENDKKITNKHYTGYIDFNSFCFVYCIMCQLRGLSGNAIFDGLDLFAKKAVKDMYHNPIYNAVSPFLEDGWAESVFYAYSEDLNKAGSELEEAQKILAEKRQELAKKEELLHEIEQRTTTLQQRIKSQINLVEYNPILRKLSHMTADFQLSEEISDLNFKKEALLSFLGCKKAESSNTQKEPIAAKKAYFVAKQKRPHLSTIIIAAICAVLILVVVLFVFILQ